MCDSWKLPRGRELTVPEVETVFKKIGQLDVVRLTGGEPFLRQDMLEIAEAVRKASNPAVLHITTNGSFLDRAIDFVKRFSATKRLRFMVSLDGLEQEHDANRGQAVNFKKVTEAIEELAGMRARYGFQVNVNHTIISKQSMEDNEGIRALCERLKIEAHCVLAYAGSSMYSKERVGTSSEDLLTDTGFPLYGGLDGSDPVAFTKNELERSEKIRNPFMRWGKQFYLRGLLDRLEGRSRRPRCVALRSHIRLLPDGSLPVCQFNTRTVGNLADESFKEVWHNEKSKQNRKWVDQCAGCWAECEVVPNAIYSGSLLTSLARGVDERD
jgi:MoaA/NifB/PqqE/SkfB family radical SAM enzyme